VTYPSLRWVGCLIGLMLAPWACMCVVWHGLVIWVGAAWETLRDD
jgi:hypothetical protein